MIFNERRISCIRLECHPCDRLYDLRTIDRILLPFFIYSQNFIWDVEPEKRINDSSFGAVILLALAPAQTPLLKKFKFGPLSVEEYSFVNFHFPAKLEV